MELVYFLVPLALLLGLFFLVSFLIAARAGEFNDLDTPAHRILLDDERGDEKK